LRTGIANLRTPDFIELTQHLLHQPKSEAAETVSPAQSVKIKIPHPTTPGKNQLDHTQKIVDDANAPNPQALPKNC